MLSRYLLPLLAVAGLGATMMAVQSDAREPFPAKEPPVAAPPASPFGRTISGSGLVEASSENIPVGTAIAGLVERVHVRVGQEVREGDPLFEVDGRALRAERVQRLQAVRQREAEVARLRALPRPEDVPPARARFAAAQVQLDDARSDLERAEQLRSTGAVSSEVIERRHFAVAAAQARVAEAQADLDLLLAGAWKPQLAVAEADLAAAQAALDATDVELARLVVRAPLSGQVLDVEARVGQFAPAGALEEPLVLLGSTATLHVRVDIDENDAWRVQPGARARASLRGNPARAVELQFVRIEPTIIPKRSLTGFSTERVDTRVLQVLFAFPRQSLPEAYVGTLMDVRIEEMGGSGAAPSGS